MIRDTLAPFLIVGFVEIPALQIIPLLIFNIFLVLAFLVLRPFKLLSISIEEIANGLIYISTLVLLVVIMAVGGSISENVKYYILGNSIILLVLMSFMVFLAFCIIGGLMQLKELLSSCKIEEKKEEKKFGYKRQDGMNIAKRVSIIHGDNHPFNKMREKIKRKTI